MHREPSVLVTGASGLLGKAVVAELSKKVKVIGVSKTGRRPLADALVVGEKPAIMACDLTKEKLVQQLFKNLNFTLVIHTAAYSDVDGCERHPEWAYAVNALATKYLAQACASKKIPLVYISTDYVFDGRRTSPYLENYQKLPVNIYGITKLQGEIWCQHLAPIHAIVRTSWLFGAGHDRNFVNTVIGRMRTEKLVRVLDDQIDSPTYVEDLAVCLKKIGERLVHVSQKNSGKKIHEIFQICNAGATTRYGMALKIKEILGFKEVRVKKLLRKDIVGRFAVRPCYTVMSTRRFENFFKFPLRKWQDSLRAYLSGQKEATA